MPYASGYSFHDDTQTIVKRGPHLVGAAHALGNIALLSSRSG